ncbi:protein phosphatase regulator [Cordyceps fumosorosea ARSEF 2679]|uniref:Protein phosphatase regulator n=1 Tax=Cordyceps fumosorosea (strain ARSEF 2679) TaxID=1081104 RepID=A0A167LL63_CORFA|nr:protein phosphatase regulator [Cordyceps fumosorosea ARSEF 2679]OAA53216.1 protein phosphatase regulator [Cordyceps fumosorosea ARSEF 2679]
MPYTPPSRSPASSISVSPDVSRRSSIHNGSRPSLPHSASYLNKHRRTPSITTVSPEPTPVHPPNSSLRQSPPPVTDIRPIPAGAIISPPESASGSDDEFKSSSQDDLKDLRDAVSQLSQGTLLSSDENLAYSAYGIPSQSPMRISFSTTALSPYPGSPGRHISHGRSATEPHAGFSASAETSATISSESEEDLRYKPQMVRKKSGELVRPALRGSSRRRPSSMPGTPVFSKAVHFDSHLEHVRHFLQVDRPLAVSAGSSPVEAYESDNEYPFPGGPKTRTPPFEWELATTNFPHDNNLIRRALPARLEKVWLSKDQKSLQASISVANLTFEKLITCRFTLDGWKTTSEVTGEYTCPIDAREGTPGHDRFTVSIQLADTANLECKTLFLCIRYLVNGQEYWDNNSGSNFQVDFHKKYLPQRGKGQFNGTNKAPGSLPRSSRRQSHSTTPRPVSMPASLDDFADEPGFRFDQPLHEYLGECGSGLRLKSKSFNNLASDNMIKSLATPSGAAFANRYDFGASLDAVKSRKDSSPKEADTLYMKSNTKGSLLSNLGAPHTVVVAAPGTAIASSSYEELVNKYCFFGGKSSPQETPARPKVDTADAQILEKYEVSPPASPNKDSIATMKTAEYVLPKPTLRSMSPSFTPATGTTAADVALQAQQTPGRFVPATAIRG